MNPDAPPTAVCFQFHSSLCQVYATFWANVVTPTPKCKNSCEDNNPMKSESRSSSTSLYLIQQSTTVLLHVGTWRSLSSSYITDSTLWSLSGKLFFHWFTTGQPLNWTDRMALYLYLWLRLRYAGVSNNCCDLYFHGTSCTLGAQLAWRPAPTETWVSGWSGLFLWTQFSHILQKSQPPTTCSYYPSRVNTATVAFYAASGP